MDKTNLDKFSLPSELKAFLSWVKARYCSFEFYNFQDNSSALFFRKKLLFDQSKSFDIVLFHVDIFSILELVDAAIPSQHMEPYKHTILGVDGVKASKFQISGKITSFFLFKFIFGSSAFYTFVSSLVP